MRPGPKPIAAQYNLSLRGVPRSGHNRMPLLVLVEVRALAESTAVLGARIGPLAGVRAPVTHRAAVAHEGFAALVTHVQPLGQGPNARPHRGHTKGTSPSAAARRGLGATLPPAPGPAGPAGPSRQRPHYTVLRQLHRPAPDSPIRVLCWRTVGCRVLGNLQATLPCLPDG